MRKLLLLLALCLALPLQAAEDYKEIGWEALVPKGWDPTQDLKALLNSGKLQDSDPRAMEALEKMKALWDAAPTVPAMAGAKVRLPGFAIPLENKGGKVSEFILVPYFGACIHSPPPPANQIVQVLPHSPVKGLRSMDAVWITGVLSTVRTDSYMGAASYRIDAQSVAPYEEKAH